MKVIFFAHSLCLCLTERHLGASASVLKNDESHRNNENDLWLAQMNRIAQFESNLNAVRAKSFETPQTHYI